MYFHQCHNMITGSVLLNVRFVHFIQSALKDSSVYRFARDQAFLSDQKLHRDRQTLKESILSDSHGEHPLSTP